MNVSETPQFGQRVLKLGQDLEARATPTANVENGRVVAIDLRLYRRIRGGGPHIPTSAGFRIPAQTLRELANGLLDLARDLEAIAEADGPSEAL